MVNRALKSDSFKDEQINSLWKSLNINFFWDKMHSPQSIFEKQMTWKYELEYTYVKKTRTYSKIQLAAKYLKYLPCCLQVLVLKGIYLKHCQ